MKILDLLENQLISPTITHKKRPNTQKRFTHTIDDKITDNSKNKRIYKGFEFKGKGSYGTVLSHIRTPGDVTKFSIKLSKLEEDGYYHYITNLILHNMMDNPYAPKIYDVVIYKNNQNHYRYNVKMEKLIPLEYGDDDNILSIARKIFGIDAVDAAENDNSPNDILDAIIMTIDLMIKGTNKEIYGLKIIDEDLINLCKMIYNIKENRYVDIVSNNMMLRMSNIGPHLVISDPLA